VYNRRTLLATVGSEYDSVAVVTELLVPDIPTLLMGHYPVVCLDIVRYEARRADYEYDVARAHTRLHAPALDGDHGGPDTRDSVEDQRYSPDDSDRDDDILYELYDRVVPELPNHLPRAFVLVHTL
jgi:hypothetical protein